MLPEATIVLNNLKRLKTNVHLSGSLLSIRMPFRGYKGTEIYHNQFPDPSSIIAGKSHQKLPATEEAKHKVRTIIFKSDVMQ